MVPKAATHKNVPQDFPGDPVVKTPRFQVREMRKEGHSFNRKCLHDEQDLEISFATI